MDFTYFKLLPFGLLLLVGGTDGVEEFVKGKITLWDSQQSTKLHIASSQAVSNDQESNQLFESDGTVDDSKWETKVQWEKKFKVSDNSKSVGFTYVLQCFQSRHTADVYKMRLGLSKLVVVADVTSCEQEKIKSYIYTKLPYIQKEKNMEQACIQVDGKWTLIRSENAEELTEHYETSMCDTEDGIDYWRFHGGTDGYGDNGDSFVRWIQLFNRPQITHPKVQGVTTVRKDQDPRPLFKSNGDVDDSEWARQKNFKKTFSNGVGLEYDLECFESLHFNPKAYKVRLSIAVMDLVADVTSCEPNKIFENIYTLNPYLENGKKMEKVCVKSKEKWSLFQSENGEDISELKETISCTSPDGVAYWNQ